MKQKMMFFAGRIAAFVAAETLGRPSMQLSESQPNPVDANWRKSRRDRAWVTRPGQAQGVVCERFIIGRGLWV
jgi:hypothetical protein